MFPFRSSGGSRHCAHAIGSPERPSRRFGRVPSVVPGKPRRSLRRDIPFGSSSIFARSILAGGRGLLWRRSRRSIPCSSRNGRRKGGDSNFRMVKRVLIFADESSVGSRGFARQGLRQPSSSLTRASCGPFSNSSAARRSDRKCPSSVESSTFRATRAATGRLDDAGVTVPAVRRRSVFR